MSGIIAFLACLLGFCAVALAAPKRAWLPADYREQNNFDVGVAVGMALAAVALAFLAGRISG